MRRVFVCAVALLVCMAGSAFAQETTSGSIAGQVVDAQNLAIPGATVTVTSAQGSQTFVTDSEGRFFAPFLTPGQYTVRVELQGFKPVERRDVGVSLGQRVELPFTLTVGALTETVQVEAGSPTIDTSTTTVGATLDSELLQRVPVGRTFTDALYLAPGVSSSGGAGQANPSVSGASGLENQYIVDGVNTTNSGYGAVGSYSIVFGSLGTGVPFDFLKEIQVKTGGYEAEYGQATGGVVNVVTKSGSNAMSGSIFGYTRPSGLEGNYTPVISTNGSRSEAVNFTGTQQSDFGAEIGGPIVEDRLFYFGAIDPQWQRTTLIAPENFPLRSLGGVDRDRQLFPYAAKLSWHPASGSRLDFSAFGDPSEGDNGPQRRSALLRTDTTAYSKIEYGGNNQTLKYEGVLRPNWLLEASVSRAANNITETPSVDTWSVTDSTVPGHDVITGGIGFFEVGNDGTNLQYQAKSTHFIGGHEIRYGVEFEDIEYLNTIDRTGPSFTTPDGQQTATGASITVLPDPRFGQIFRVTRANLSNVRDTTQHYLSFFAQDTWRFGRLTVKPGIRYEQQKLVGNVSDFTWDNNWAPRIGVTYDLMGNGRTKLFGSWGRFFAQVPNDLAARALSADAGITRADYFDADLTQPIPEGTAAGPTGDTTHYITAGLSASEFDPTSKSTYQDEWVVGAQHELVQNVSVGVNYVRRRFGRILEDVGTAPMLAYQLGTVPASVEYFITNPGVNTPVAGDVGQPVSFEDPIHEYDAVQFSAEKRFSHNWGLQASYRWSRLHGTYEGFFRNDNGQSDPAITSLFDFPTNDPTYATAGRQFGFMGDIRYLGALGAGPLPLDRPHQVKVYGNYMTPFGLNVGLGLQVGSGAPLTALAANPVYDSPGEIPMSPRGDGFQTEDGFRTRTPWQKQIDLHLGYDVNLGPRRITLLADAFNLFNTQTVLEYDNFTEVSFQVPNPDFGRRLVYQTPFQLRLGARFSF